MFSCSRNSPENLQLETISFQTYQHCYLIHTLSGTVYKSTIENRALSSMHPDPLEITLIVFFKVIIGEISIDV